MTIRSKTFRVSFPVVAGGYDRVDIKGEELTKFEAMNEHDQKEYLMKEVSGPMSLCHECSNSVEEVQIDDDHLGNDEDEYANVGFWEDEGD